VITVFPFCSQSKLETSVELGWEPRVLESVGWSSSVHETEREPQVLDMKAFRG